MRQAIIVDYVMPLLHVTEDLPLTIKDQIIKAAVLFEMYANEEMGNLQAIQAVGRGKWKSLFNKLINRDPVVASLAEYIETLWATDEARILHMRHGNFHHDVERDLIGGIPFVMLCGNGGIACGIEPPLNLNEEILVIDSQRIKAGQAYNELVRYADVLSKRLLDNTTSGRYYFDPSA